MFDMTVLQMMGMAWGLVSVVLVVVLLHRLMLGIHEDDELFVNTRNPAIEQEQAINTRRIVAVTPWVRGLVTLWGVLIVAMVGTWIYQGLY
jgi:hypothetical protein